MDGNQGDDIRGALAALIDPIARAARRALALDERQPDALRAEAPTMPAERAFWTLTQLDGGLDLDICQALVRAARLARGRLRPRRPPAAELAAARAAALAAGEWLLGRQAWARAADAPPDRPTRPPPPAWPPAPGGVPHWLDAPPVIGPPPGAPPGPHGGTPGRALAALLLGGALAGWALGAPAALPLALAGGAAAVAACPATRRG